MMGYKLIVPNIAIDKQNWFEDWWIHPELVNPKIIELLTTNSENNIANEYIFSKK
jgi:hypothetical protein